MKKIYYVIQREVEDIGGGYYELTGIKDVRLYQIDDNNFKLISNLYLELSDNTESKIKDYLLDNLLFQNENQFELIQL